MDRYFIIYFVVIILVITGCAKVVDSDCPAELLPTASFQMGARMLHFGGVDTLIETDTVLTSNTVEFIAAEGFTNYRWRIGEDDRIFTDRSVSLVFDEPEAEVRVELIATGIEENPCFPLGNISDTVVKYLTVFPRRKNPIYGTFRGVLLDQPMDTFEVDVFIDPIRREGFHTVNINRGCYPESIPGFSLGLAVKETYKRFVFGDSESFLIGPCFDPRGWYTISPDGQSLRVEYSILDTVNATRRTQKFIGQYVE